MNWDSWILSYMIDSFSGLLRVLVTYYLAWSEFSAKLFRKVNSLSKRVDNNPCQYAQKCNLAWKSSHSANQTT